MELIVPNNFLGFKTLGNIVSKWWIQKSSCLSWSFGVINYLNRNIFVSSTVTWAEKTFYKLFLFKSPLSFTIQFNVWFILIKSQMKRCDSGTNILFSTSFTRQQIYHVYTDAINSEIYVILFSCHSTLNFTAQI